jgi:formylglycine-generating enzyme required for sulfatase activity
MLANLFLRLDLHSVFPRTLLSILLSDMNGKIFINYRREDDPGNTGRLADRLQEAFPEQLFMDVDSIAPGLDFVQVLQEQVAKCDVLLAVIGKNWVDARDATGARRLDNPEDYVRIEIASALTQNKLVIPVLMGNTLMPRPSELPEAIKPLARHNAVRLTHDRFRTDVQSLIKALTLALDEADAVRRADAEALRQAQEEEERKREEAAANERARVVHEAEEQARLDKEQARLKAVAGLSAEHIAKAEELANWEFIKDSSQPQDFRDHLVRFPAGVCEHIARHKLAALVWGTLGDAPRRAALTTYLEEFPEGPHAEKARALVASFERGDAQQAALQDPPPKQPPETTELEGDIGVSRIADRSQQHQPPQRSRVMIAVGACTAVALVGIAGWVLYANSHRPSQPPVMTAGEMTINTPSALTFTGPQGGPFTPSRLTLQMRATGPGFHWSAGETLPSWIDVVPRQGELAANSLAEIVLTPSAAAQSLAPGQYHVDLNFTNVRSFTKHTVDFVVLSRPTSTPCGENAATVASLSLRPPQILSRTEECALKPKDVFKECAGCPEIAVVSAGSFTMGSPTSEEGHQPDENPQHVVRLARQFAVGRFAVTFDEWDVCVSDGGCNGWKPGDQGWGRGRRPVINISWNDAKAYVVWLSKKTGKHYRLLTEAEREYVTRAGTTTPFWWGGSISTSQANYNGRSTYGSGVAGEYRARTLPVDSFKANPSDLFQVHGNVWEWVEDCYQDNYRGVPSDGAPWTLGECKARVLRGGSWDRKPSYLRSAARLGWAPNVRDNSFGMRVARTLAP